MSARTSTVALLAAAALGVGACGEDETVDSASTTPQPAATATQTPVPAPEPTTTTTAPATKATYEISKDLGVKPAIPKPTGDPPAELVVQDVVKGKGESAKSGDNVTVDYVGISYSTGQQFDASWDGGEPFSFALGTGGVIPGWDQGAVGMRKGGRRLLVIPPDLGYGAEGRPGIAPNETLVFVIDMKKLG